MSLGDGPLESWERLEVPPCESGLRGDRVDWKQSVSCVAKIEANSRRLEVHNLSCIHLGSPL